MPADQRSVIDRPLFIVGCPRSGTGILHQLVRLHPSVAWITPFSNWICGKSWFRSVPPTAARAVETLLHRMPTRLLPPLLRGPFDGSLGLPYTFETHEGHSIWNRVFRDHADHHATDDAATSARRADLRDAVRWHLAYHDRPRFVWKTPRNVFRLRFLQAVFPTLKVVHLVRDGRAVAASILKRRLHDRGRLDEWWGARPPGWHSRLDDRPIQQAAWTWRQSLEYAREAATHLGDDQYLELRYESLTRDPESTLHTLFSWADLDPDAFFTADRAAPLDQIRPARPTWKSRLDEEQKALLEEALGPTLRRHGYLDQ